MTKDFAGTRLFRVDRSCQKLPNLNSGTHETNPRGNVAFLRQAELVRLPCALITTQKQCGHMLLPIIHLSSFIVGIQPLSGIRDH